MVGLATAFSAAEALALGDGKHAPSHARAPLPLEKCLVTEGKNLFKNHLPIRSTNPTSMGQVKDSENHFRYLLYCVENEHFLLQYIFCFGQNSMLETCTDMMIVC